MASKDAQVYAVDPNKERIASMKSFLSGRAQVTSAERLPA
jgi:hypothetical protein